MRLVIQGIVFALLLALLGERGYAAYRWKVAAETAQQQAASADHWLHDPVLTANGKPLSRSDLIDIFLAKALRGSAAPAPAGK